MPIKWKTAKAMPTKEWENAGSINKIYLPVFELLKRLQRAYKAYHGGKRPSLAEITTYALCEASYLIERKAKDFEDKVAAREALANFPAVEKVADVDESPTIDNNETPLK